LEVDSLKIGDWKMTSTRNPFFPNVHTFNVRDSTVGTSEQAAALQVTTTGGEYSSIGTSTQNNTAFQSLQALGK
jgi:hypothetical protein